MYQKNSCKICGEEFDTLQELKDHVTSVKGHDMVWYDYITQHGE